MQSSAFKLAHQVVVARSGDHNTKLFQPTLARATINVWGANSHQSCIRLQIGAGFCAVLAVDAVATSEVNLMV